MGVISKLLKGAALKRSARYLPVYKVIAVAEMALLAREHVGRLEPRERWRLTELVRHRRELGPAEQEELRGLTAKLAPKEFAGMAAHKLSPVPLPRRLTGVPKDR